jgi:signal peptide peptidase SppA
MRILDILNAPWAMEAGKYNEMVEIYLSHLRGPKIDIVALEARMGAPLPGPTQGYGVRDGVAVVPVDGILSKRITLLQKMSGGTSLELLSRDFRAAMADPAAHSVVLLIDSPGGATMGLQELAEEVYRARSGVKPVIALSDGMMASAAYWLGSAAREAYISSDMTMVGSIGVLYRHIDVSKANEKDGIKVTEIYAGKYKTMVSSDSPLSDDARADIQAKVDKLYGLFVDTVARNRGVDAATVLERMAEARVFLGKEAIDAGLVDGAATLDEVIAGLNAGRKPVASTRFAAGGAAAAAVPTGAGDAPQPQPEIKGDPVNKDFILTNHPDIAEAFRAEGYARGKDEGFAAGALAERQRIQSIEAQAMPGHGELIAKLKYDGKTTGAEAAVQVLAAERTKLGKTATDLAADAGALAGVRPTPAADPGADAAAAAAQAEASKPLEERCKAKWDRDAKLRAEYGEQYDAYLAFEKAHAEGRVKILGARQAA